MIRIKELRRTAEPVRNERKHAARLGGAEADVRVEPAGVVEGAGEREARAHLRRDEVADVVGVPGRRVFEDVVFE